MTNSFIVDTARFWKGTKEQEEALRYVESCLTPEQLKTAQDKWRAKPKEQPKPSGEVYLYCKWSGKYDEYGLKIFGLYLMNEDIVIDKVAACSGQSYAQDTPWPLDDYSGSMRPCPEGVYDLGAIDDLGYDPGSGDGFGQWVIPLNPRAAIKRSALLLHSDRNRSASPGSAGCICPYDPKNMARIVGWCTSKTAPKYLIVDHQLGFLSQEEAKVPRLGKPSAPPANVTGADWLRNAHDFIKGFEKCSLVVYEDAVGMPTIGWGLTFYPDGQTVRIGDPPITQAQADNDFDKILNRFLDALVSTTPGWEKLPSGCKAALLSFSYNTGWNYGANGFNTLNRVVETANWNELPGALMLYCKGDGKVLLGLQRRRWGEVLLTQNETGVNAYEKSKDKLF